MDAQQAFTHFVLKCLTPDKARRFAALSDTKKGQRKILNGLYHEFESAIRADAVRAGRRGSHDKFWESACFVFHESVGFGAEFDTVREAYDQLSLDDGWLILLRDASTGIHRPEAPRWDYEKIIAG
jgi:hypothetical protein